MTSALKKMAAEIVELENDLQVSENTCDEYAALVSELEAKLRGE
jgi:hypothetical protein